MDGTISKIIMKDENHGLIMYRNIDTSQGQSGSMIMLTEEPSKVAKLADINSSNMKKFPVGAESGVRILGTNIGVHCGGAHRRNWGTLISPTIM